MPVYLSNAGIRKGETILIRRCPLEPDHEVIEKKGRGHPDSIADSLASNISRAYSSYTIKHCGGKILHHQIDKLMVIGGKSDVTWGKGRSVAPIKIIVAGRASKSYLHKKVPVDRIVEKEIRKFFSTNFPILNYKKDIEVQLELTDYAGPGTIKQSTGAIANMFNPVNKSEIRGYEKLVSNDTSFCVAYAPYSRLESTVIKLENALNGTKTKKKFPWLGSDIKIMAVRNRNRIDITSCIPQIARFVNSLESYKNNLKKISKFMIHILTEYYPKNQINLSLNTKDDFDKMNVYLTATGSSLSGDIGVVGRGNRINGLITSQRPMSLEGVSGKNPKYYSGFVYSMLAKNIANHLYRATKRPCEVEIVSQNGGPLLDPWKVIVTSDYPKQTKLRKIIDKELSKIPDITRNFVHGKN